jgi:hypothetical protein
MADKDTPFDRSDQTDPISWARAFTREHKPQQENRSPGDSDQWLRKIQLTVYGGGGSGDGIELTGSQDPNTKQYLPSLRVNFQVRKNTLQSPNLFNARIYNLSKETMAKVIEQKKVSLSAGYRHGRYGVIYRGTVVQFVKGKENATDTYLEIQAGDGDTLVFDALNTSYDKGTTNEATVKDALSKLGGGIKTGTIDMGDWGKQQLVRQRAYSGMIINFMRDHMNAGNLQFFVDDEQAHVIARNKYRPGATIELSPTTGLVGIPEVTPQGIQARCLLNPNLVLGGLIKISTDLLSGVPYTPGSSIKKESGQAGGGGSFPAPDIPFESRFPVATWGAQLNSAFTSPTGTYKILLLEHTGDTRGNPWYSEMICVALDQAGQAIWSPDLPVGRTAVNAWGGPAPASTNTQAPAVTDANIPT